MQITVSGHQMDVTEPLRTYVAEKISRLQRHFDNMITSNVVLHVEKNRHKAEATIRAKGVTLHADAEDADMYAAIDLLADKLDRQVLKHKEKTTSHHRSQGSHKKSL
ncbi:MAG: ribosomal subunit interface protein [Candidatus Muproteobacteria bacterium RBG_16_60_9]|uniref:Ribosome hibernation promoting factor n=1 Tax=Candidatus Muproteobacteria bacterium RBG_16_60_9 TaxID=1817755 RepID=A0A1F6UVF4_9PROT|nr:MAG: ribosomal subunit interface protein [Candidatus Muproteobacteria bacterium RBG_16_60_9]